MGDGEKVRARCKWPVPPPPIYGMPATASVYLKYIKPYRSMTFIIRAKNGRESWNETTIYNPGALLDASKKCTAGCHSEVKGSSSNYLSLMISTIILIIISILTIKRSK